MISFDRLEDLLKVGGTLEEEEAREILNKNAANGSVLKEAAEKGYFNVVKFFVEAKEHFKLTCEEELMCSNSVAVDGDLNTPLHLAALNGHSNIVEYIISLGEPADIENRYKETPLYLACSRGHELVVEFLIQHGASVLHICERRYRRPIEVAAFNGHVVVVQQMVARGTPASMGLVYASEAGHDNVVALLLQHKQIDAIWLYAVSMAAASGQLRVCQMLLNAGCNGRNLFEYILSPIKGAAKYGHINVLQLLLSHCESKEVGSSLKLFSLERNSKCTAIDLAIIAGHIGITNILISHGYSLNREFVFERTMLSGRLLAVLSLRAMGGDLNSVDPTTATALHLACRGKLEMIQFVLAKGASVKARDSDFNTPLHTACRYSRDERVVRYLISRGAELNAVNKEGKTPLHVAKHFSIQKALIESGADPNIPLITGETLLHLTKSVELAEMLLERNVLVDARTTEGVTPLMYACEHGNRDIVSLLLKHSASVNTMNQSKSTTPLLAAVQTMRHDIVELLLNNDADVNYLFGIKNKTVLHRACQYKDPKSVLILLKSGAAVNARTVDASSPLHYAVHVDSAHVVNLLTKYGAHINAVNIHGRTPFHFVRTLKIARLLLEGGADPTLKDKNGQTPLDCAEVDGLQQMVLSFGASK